MQNKYTEITPNNLIDFLTVFYGKIRKHDILGNIFEIHIGTNENEWKEHIIHISTFWSSIILKTRNFQGTPMQVHQSMPELRAEHFPMWLEIFHSTALEKYTENMAQVFIEYSQRIGQSLSMGVEIHRQKMGEDY